MYYYSSSKEFFINLLKRIIDGPRKTMDINLGRYLINNLFDFFRFLIIIIQIELVGNES